MLFQAMAQISLFHGMLIRVMAQISLFHGMLFQAMAQISLFHGMLFQANHSRSLAIQFRGFSKLLGSFYSDISQLIHKNGFIFLTLPL
jgi:hypothetical protein